MTTYTYEEQLEMLVKRAEEGMTIYKQLEDQNSEQAANLLHRIEKLIEMADECRQHIEEKHID